MTTTLLNENTMPPTPALPTSLGELRRTYGQTMSHKMTLLASPIIFGVLALAALFVLRPMLVNGFGPFAALANSGVDLGTYVLIIPAVLGLATLLHLVRLRGSWGTAVHLHQHGIAFNQKGQRQEWLWQDFRGIQQRIIQFYSYGVVPVGKTYNYWLSSNRGQMLHLDQNISQVQELIAEIQTHINPLLFHKAANAYRQGQTFLFGVVGLSQTGLSCNGKTFAWEQLAEIEVSNGNLQISPKNGGFFSNVGVDTSQIENLEVLLTLIQEVKKSRQ